MKCDRRSSSEVSGFSVGVIDDPPALLVLLKYRHGLPSAEVPYDRDATLFKSCDPLSWFGTFVKSDRFRIAGSSTTQDPPDAGPGNGSETHGARLATGDQFMSGYPCCAEVEMPDSVLRVGEGHHFGMGQ